jgi:hypothetical protein
VVSELYDLIASMVKSGKLESESLLAVWRSLAADPVAVAVALRSQLESLFSQHVPSARIVLTVRSFVDAGEMSLAEVVLRRTTGQPRSSLTLLLEEFGSRDIAGLVNVLLARLRGAEKKEAIAAVKMKVREWLASPERRFVENGERVLEQLAREHLQSGELNEFLSIVTSENCETLLPFIAICASHQCEWESVVQRIPHSLAMIRCCLAQASVPELALKRITRMIDECVDQRLLPVEVIQCSSLAL